MFSQEYRVRYSDLSPGNIISYTGLLNMFQDISIAHSAQTGYTVEELNKNGVAWLLGGWRVRIYDKNINFGTVTVETGVCDILRCQSHRQYVMTAGNRKIAHCKALWFMADTVSKKPIRVPADISDKMEIFEDVTNLSFEKFRPLEDFKSQMDFKVLKKDLDTNHHLNNIKSFDYLNEILPEDFNCRELEVSYKKNTVYGDKLHVGGGYTSDGAFQSELRDDNGNIITMCKFYN